MWLIGIRSGMITILALIAYGLLVDLLHLQASIGGHLEHIVLALGIYSGHYYYKQAHQGYMTYGQGIQIGLIVVAFTGLVSGICTYLVSKFVDPGFIKRLAASVQSALEQPEIQQEHSQKVLAFMDTTLTPHFFSIIIFLSTCLVGIILNLVIAAFARCVKPKAGTSSP